MMQKKSKIKLIRFKDEKGWRRIKDIEKEVPPEVHKLLGLLIDKFGCEILAVKEAK